MRSEDSGEEKTLSLPRSETRSTGGLPSLQRLEGQNEVKWDSMNLIDASTKHLYGLMTGLDGKDPSQVMTAVEVAKGIQSLMRLQLDAFRAKQGMKNK